MQREARLLVALSSWRRMVYLHHGYHHERRPRRLRRLGGRASHPVKARPPLFPLVRPWHILLHRHQSTLVLYPFRRHSRLQHKRKFSCNRQHPYSPIPRHWFRASHPPLRSRSSRYIRPMHHPRHISLCCAVPANSRRCPLHPSPLCAPLILELPHLHLIDRLNLSMCMHRTNRPLSPRHFRHRL